MPCRSDAEGILMGFPSLLCKCTARADDIEILSELLPGTEQGEEVALNTG